MKPRTTYFLSLLSLSFTAMPTLGYEVISHPHSVAGLAPSSSSLIGATEDTLLHLTAAERNYLLASMALFVDAIADDIESKPLFQQKESLAAPIRKRLRTTDIPTAELSEAQRAYLAAERQIQLDALEAMEGLSDSDQYEYFAQMKKQLRELRDNASPEVQKLQQDSVAFAPLSNELRVEDRISAIIAEAQASSDRRIDQEIFMVTKLRALAENIRSMRTEVKSFAKTTPTEQRISVK